MKKNTFASSLSLCAALAAAAAAGAASAADVSLYGQIDTGLVYKDGKGASPTFTMDNGVDVSTYWGVKGRENLGNGRYVRFVLESGFDSGTGAFTNTHSNGATGDFFSRESSLTIGSSSIGEVTFGRQGGFLGSTGTYAQWAAMGMNPLASNSLDAALVGAFDNSPIMDNAVTVKSRDFGGLTLLGQYSNGVSSESGHFSKDDHIYALATGFKRGDLSLSAVWQMRAYPNAKGLAQPKDAKPTNIFFLGAGKNFGIVRVLAAYQHVENARGILGAPNTISAAKFGLPGETSREGFRADAVSLGAHMPLAGGRLHGSVKMVHAAWQGESADDKRLDDDGERYVVAAKYAYPLSKKTGVYVLATHGEGTGLFDNTAESRAASTRTIVAAGIHTKF